MSYAATRLSDDEWRVAAGSLIAASFTGEDAEVLAREYANERNRQLVTAMIQDRNPSIYDVSSVTCPTKPGGVWRI